MSELFARRTLLKGLSAAGVIGMSNGVGFAAPQATFFKRLGIPIGLQLYTLGDEPAKDLEGVFAKVAAIGYRDLELPSLLGKTPTKLRAAADRFGMKFSNIHLASTPNMPKAMLSLMSDTQRILDDLGILGINNVVLPIVLFPDNFRPEKGEDMKAAIGRAFATAGPDIWKRTAALLNEKAAALKPHGITVGYHNHNLEFAPIGKTNGWEILAHETDKSLVYFEVDIGWIAAAGLDPVAFLKRHTGRVRWLHVKDLKATTKPNFALQMDPTEIGSGKQDWARILPAAHKAGVKHFYVEQEPPFSMPKLDAAAKSYAFLDKLKA